MLSLACAAIIHSLEVFLEEAMDARVAPAHDADSNSLSGFHFPSASAIRPSVPTMTRHHSNNVKPWRVT